MNRPTKKEISDYLKKLRNPYAKLSIIDQDNTTPVQDYIRDTENPYSVLSQLYDPRETTLVKKPKLSKKDFIAGCRNIFLQYIPTEDRKQIRFEHKDFIDRNMDENPEIRYALLNKLKKYDLSNDYRTYFNRERDDLTISKLNKIEKECK